MAKVKKEIREPKKKAFKPWLEDKISSARKQAKSRAARAAQRYGGPAGVALIILLISLSLFLPKNEFQRVKERLAQSSSDFEAHLALAEEYLKNNQFEAAEKELLLAQESQSPKILGLVTINLEKVRERKRQSNPTDIRKLITLWEKITQEKPDYRDGYFQIAVLYYKLGENEKVREYVEKTLLLDPNFEPAGKLIQELESRE